MSTRLAIEVSAGELVDRLTILEVKHRRLRDPAKRRVVAEELERLGRVRAGLGDEPHLQPLEIALRVVNDRLWTTEDAIREQDRRGDFGAGFLEAARAIYRLNDLRHSLKCEIDALLGVVSSEVKEYSRYDERGEEGRTAPPEEAAWPASS